MNHKNEKQTDKARTAEAPAHPDFALLVTSLGSSLKQLGNTNEQGANKRQTRENNGHKTRRA